MESSDSKGELRRKVVDRAVEYGEQAVERLARKRGQSQPPPELTAEPVFAGSLPWSKEIKARTLVITCSDARFLPQYEEFLKTGLGIQDYDLVAVPGGVQWLALADVLPKHHKVARWVTEFLITKHHLQRVICIAHHDCGAYQDAQSLASLAMLVSGKSVAQFQLDHLRTAGRNLAEWTHVAVDLYYASVEDGKVAFRKIG